MQDGDDDPIWEAVVTCVLSMAAAHERTSRYGGKPSLWLDGREIAHREAPGAIDLRLTHAGWAQVRDEFGTDQAVQRDPARRDWIGLQLTSAAELARLTPLIATAVAANRAQPDRSRRPSLPVQSREDTDAAWGEHRQSDDDERYHRDRPPHWHSR